MRRIAIYWVWVAATLVGASAAIAETSSKPLMKPHVKAVLLADRDAVTAGAPLRMAVAFDLDKDWHIYWSNGGEPDAPAMPTTFEWKVPDGFNVGRAMFPAPHRHVTVGGDLYILEGKPIVLFDVQVPATISGDSVTLAVRTDWLVCKESCIPGGGELKLTLPVKPAGTSGSAANADRFNAGDAALPEPIAKSAFVSVSGTVVEGNAQVVGKGVVEIKLDVIKNHHIQAHVSAEGLIATDVFLEPVDGITIGAVEYPKGHERELPGVGKISEYSGTVALRVPFVVDDAKTAGDSLHGVIRYQSCKDDGECHPPAEYAFAIALRKNAARPAENAAADNSTESRVVTGERVETDHLSFNHSFHAPLQRGVESVIDVTLDVKSGYHAQSNTPAEGLIPTVVTVKPRDGVTIGKIEYPPGHERSDPVLGTLSEYNGKAVIRVPVTVASSVDGESITLNASLGYQACEDSGTCYPPQNVAFKVEIPLTGAVIGAATPPVQNVVEAPNTKSGEVAVDSGPTNQPGADVASRIASNAGASGSSSASSSASSSGSSGGGFSLMGSINDFQDWLATFGLVGYFVAAFLGGFVLNVMPCVLPVISLKVLSFVRQGGESRAKVFLLGASFSAGIVVSFLAIGVLIVGLGQVWGGQFQSPEFSIIMAGIVLAFALSMFGVFHINPPEVANALGGKAGAQEGPFSAFCMGLLATVLGTACTAPMISFVVAFAAKQSPVIGLSIFLMAGLGMAIPYVVLSLFPELMAFIPKAGPWMITFERVMGFVLLGTVIWLLNPIPNQLTGEGLKWAIVFLLFVAFACWLYGRIQYGDPVRRRLRYVGAVVVTVVLGWAVPFQWLAPIQELKAESVAIKKALAAVANPFGEVWENAKSGEIPWQYYSPKVVSEAVNAGYVVFVDYTADWCANCKTNENSSLNIDSTTALMRKLNVIPFKADYTSEDPDIKADLERFERAGVPMYLVYSPNNTESPQVLPELLTPGTVHDALRTAGGKQASALANAR